MLNAAHRDMIHQGTQLGWQPRMSFEELIRMMVRADFEEESKRLYGVNYVMAASEAALYDTHEIEEVVDVGIR